MIVSQIVAKANNNAIGKDNQLIWRLSNDLKFFRKVTMGHYLITGRKNYESIGKPLPGRKMVIVTRDLNYKAEGCAVVHSVENAIAYIERQGAKECFVIGGGELYKQTLDLTTRIFLTKVDCSPEADVFYPELHDDEWQEVISEPHSSDEKNEHDFEFCLLRRRSRLD